MVLTRKQKIKGLFLFIILVMGSMVELLGVTVILPFLQAILNPEELRGKWYIQPLLEVLHIKDNRSMLLVLGIGIIFVYIIKNLFMLFVSYVQEEYSTRTQHELSVSVFKTYMKKPYIFFTETNSADIMRTIGSDVMGIYIIIMNLFTIISETILTVLIVTFLMMTDVFLSSSLLVASIVCVTFLLAIVKTPMKAMGIMERKVSSACTKNALQAINGIKEISVANKRQYFVDTYRESSNKKREAMLKYAFIKATPERIIEGICVCGFMGMLCYRIAMGKDLTAFIPQLGAFALAAFKLLPSISKISSRISGVIFYRETLHEVFCLYQNEKKDDFRKNCLVVDKRKTADFRDISVVDVENVTWQYPRAKSPVLKNIHLTIRRGEAIAFVGKSGAGKSTLADLILGLFTPKEGAILADGVSIAKIPDLWAGYIGYVPQDTFLIDDTIEKNVAFGEKDIDREKVKRALEMAQLDEFVKTLPLGLCTKVGERGVRFSGGQQQRIAIARALYQNPGLLVLDEATSALDNDTEKAIMESLDFLRGKITLIIIAHRLETIKKCDKIYQVCDGKITLKQYDDVLEKQNYE